MRAHEAHPSWIWLRRACWIEAVLLVVALATAEGSEAKPLFGQEEELSAVLEAPLSRAYGQKHSDEREYLPGRLTYTEPDGSTRSLEVSIRTRGKFRREQCRLPPLKLNFRKTQTTDTLFEGQDKLKLVSPCGSSREDQQRLYMEYLAYRSFQLLTEYSLRTRLLRLKYVDTDGRRKPWTHSVFLIEAESEAAERLGLEVVRVQAVLSRSQLDPERTELLDMVQYLIANTDYSVRAGPPGTNCCHNIEILGAKDDGNRLVPIAYDFDFSGLVDAPYAAPNPSLSIRNVRQRLYRGRCESLDSLAATMGRFQEERNRLLKLYESFEHLSTARSKRARNFIEAFYDILDDPKRVERNIIRRCLE
jgi:hypothetical protein